MTKIAIIGYGNIGKAVEEAVKAAVSRLTRDISAHDIYSACVDIAVIDNGTTLNPED